MSPAGPFVHWSVALLASMSCSPLVVLTSFDKLSLSSRDMTDAGGRCADCSECSGGMRRGKGWRAKRNGKRIAFFLCFSFFFSPQPSISSFPSPFFLDPLSSSMKLLSVVAALLLAATAVAASHVLMDEISGRWEQRATRRSHAASQAPRRPLPRDHANEPFRARTHRLALSDSLIWTTHLSVLLSSDLRLPPCSQPLRLSGRSCPAPCRRSSWICISCCASAICPSSRPLCSPCPIRLRPSMASTGRWGR